MDVKRTVRKENFESDTVDPSLLNTLGTGQYILLGAHLRSVLLFDTKRARTGKIVQYTGLLLNLHFILFLGVSL